ncbi:hypothetical protein LUZ60_003196 [Juncus effusus]|nr:hypothetical protein LUZ60_003196 [Juncus effusus]
MSSQKYITNTLSNDTSPRGTERKEIQDRREIMGNCQAAEAATVIIQHPGGKVERLYWSATAEEVMKNNPGHYVALVILCVGDGKEKERKLEGGARVTRVKLLKPKEMLLLGQVYRLITSQEVTKALQARKYEKMKTMERDLTSEKQDQREKQRDHSGKVYTVQRKHNDSKQSNQVIKQEREDRYRKSSTTTSTSAGTQQSSKGRQWRPSLNSISESFN